MYRKNGLNNIERFTWMLLQSLWVGGIWTSIIVIYPALNQSLLAPILVYSVMADLIPKIILVAMVCMLLQIILLIKSSGIMALLKSPMGQGLAIVFIAAAAFFVLQARQLLGYKMHVFLYITIAVLGIYLMFHLPPWLLSHREMERKQANLPPDI